MSAATMDMPEATGATPAAQAANLLLELEMMTALILSEPRIPLAPQMLDAFADNERVQRLTALASQSATQLIPNVSLHTEMDRLLDEMGTKTVAWQHGRSQVSKDWEDIA